MGLFRLEDLDVDFIQFPIHCDHEFQSWLLAE